MKILKGLLLTIGIFVLAFALIALPDIHLFFGDIGAVILLEIIFIVLVIVCSFA